MFECLVPLTVRGKLSKEYASSNPENPPPPGKDREREKRRVRREKEVRERKRKGERRREGERRERERRGFFFSNVPLKSGKRETKQ